MLPLTVLVTNYNTGDLTCRCVDAVARLTGDRRPQVVVVDDASTEPVQARLPAWVDYVRNDTNQGYVRSVNIGVGRARGDIVLLLDSDAEPLTDVFTPIDEAFRSRPRLGALGFKLVDRRGALTGATQPEPTALGLALGQQGEARLIGLAPWLFGQAMTIHSCAIAFRRSAFEALGGFDVGFDFLDADTDFSMRLRRAGWELAIADRGEILHEGSGSPQTTSRRVLRHHANRWRLLEKHDRLRSPLLLKSVLAARHLAELIWLNGPARWSMPADVRSDKLSARRQLLGTVWRRYSADRTSR
jgi:GT2 family glycosyltransferase